MRLIKRVVVAAVLVLVLYGGYKTFRVYQDIQHVMTYRPLVREMLGENDSVENENLVLAIIYTETKGKHDDVMQSSESSVGQANVIADNRESIENGVRYLSQNIRLAQEKKVDMWTAVQAYNFGTAYIDYVADRGGKNSLELARAYSKDVLAPSLGNPDGKSYLNWHPIALIHGGKLYVNGGNIYYSRQVAFHQHLIEWFSGF